MEIKYEEVKHLIHKWRITATVDIEDLDYLDEYLKDAGVKTDIGLANLGVLYNHYSEEVWSSSWEDNAEGQFIEWLESHKNKII